MRVIKICDYRLASYLVCQGEPVIATSQVGRKRYFHFEATDTLRDETDEFRFGEAYVRAKDLFRAQNEIKSLIFDHPVTA